MIERPDDETPEAVATEGPVEDVTEAVLISDDGAAQLANDPTVKDFVATCRALRYWKRELDVPASATFASLVDDADK